MHKRNNSNASANIALVLTNPFIVKHWNLHKKANIMHFVQTLVCSWGFKWQQVIIDNHVVLNKGQAIIGTNDGQVQWCVSKLFLYLTPDNKVHGANMGPTWGRQDPDGPRVGHMNLAIWDCSQVPL